MAVVKQILAAVGAADRQRVGFGERLEVGTSPRIPTAASHHYERPLGLCEHVAQLVHVIGSGMRGDALVARGVGNGRGRGLHVLGQREHHGPGASRYGEMKRVAHHFRHALGTVDLRHPFRHLPVHAAVVNLLERFALRDRAVDLADKQNKRRRILERGMNTDTRVGRARAARDETNAGTAGQFTVSLGHVGGAAFLAADHELDFVTRIVERIESGEIAFTRHTEHHVDAVHFERVNQELPAGAWSRGPLGMRPRRRAGSRCDVAIFLLLIARRLPAGAGECRIGRFHGNKFVVAAA